MELVKKGRVDRIWSVNPATLRGVIHGALPSMKNRRKLVMVGKKGMPKRPLFIKSDQARQYEEHFESVVWESLREAGRLPDGAKLYLKAVVYQEDLRRDLDVEFLPDLLQRFNLIENDRLIWHKEYTRELDREHPRVEFEVGIWQSGFSLFDSRG